MRTFATNFYQKIFIENLDTIWRQTLNKCDSKKVKFQRRNVRSRVFSGVEFIDQ